MLIIGMSACDLINPSDPVPAYIRINEISVDAVSGTGTTNQQFEEVWVYLNGSLAGTYSVPALIPLISPGPADLLIFPGIRVNGVRSVANFYPFFEPVEQTYMLTAGETQVIDMHTRYRSNVAVPFIEDFESSHKFTDDVDDDPDTYIQRITTDVYEGTGSGLITLTDDADFIQVASFPLLSDIPVNGTPVFLELHYKNNVDFSIGLIGHNQGIPPAQATILVLRPQEDWYKVYVDLSPALNASQLQAYQIVLTAIHNTALTESRVYLDNLKVVHIAQ